VAALRTWSVDQSTYDGRTFDQWLRDCDGSGSAQDHAAREAIRGIGTNGIPLLISRLNGRDSTWALWARKLAARQSVVRFSFVEARETRERAIEGFAALGPLAIPVVPELMRLVVEHTNESAVIAISMLGRGALPPVSQMATNTDWRYRCGAIGVLSRLDDGSVGVAAPTLLKLMEDEHWRVRSYAGYMLEYYFNPQPWMRPFQRANPRPQVNAADPSVFARALVARLGDSSPEVRVMAVGLLGRLDPAARAYRPLLEARLADEDRAVRYYATQAVARLAQDAPARAGGPVSQPRSDEDREPPSE
jgi:hypothetical protein